MRAVIVAVLLSGLASGAGAKACPLDGLEVVATSRGSDASPDLAGAKFRVVRTASRFRTGMDPSKGRIATSGEINVELIGDKGRFVVGQDYIPSSMPWISATSWKSGDPKAISLSGKRNRAQEKKLFEPDGTFDIYGGPLAGFTLEPTNCR